MSFKGLCHPDYPKDPNNKIVVHGDGCSSDHEFTACGIAFEEWEINEQETEFTDEPITCKFCIEAIELIYNKFKKAKGKWRQVS